MLPIFYGNAMGLFSGETVHSVGTSISRLIEDKSIVDTTKVAITSALYSGADVVDSILENSLNSVSINVSKLLSDSEKDTVFGNPTGEVYLNNKGKAEAKAIIDAIHNDDVEIKYCRFGLANGIHIGWMKLIELYGYNTETNTFTMTIENKPKEVYLDDMVLMLPIALKENHRKEMIEVWGIPPNSKITPERPVKYDWAYSSFFKATPAQFTNKVSVATVKVTGIYQVDYTNERGDASLISLRKSFDIPVNTYTVGKDYFHVLYELKGRQYYWMYEQGAGMYPVLDKLHNLPDVKVGNFYPNIYFRLNKKSLHTDKNSNQYKVAKKQSKYLGLDYDKLSESIDENPDIVDVAQAFISLGVPADSTDPVDLKYLYDFFELAFESYSSSNNSTAFPYTYIENWQYEQSYKTYDGSDSKAQAFVIKDKAHKMVLSNRGMIKERKPGVIGKVGAVKSGKEAYTYQIEHINYENNEPIPPTVIKVPYRYYQKQISSIFYDEIKVVDLTCQYHIFNGYRSTIGDDDKELLLIPLDAGIIQKYAFKDKELLINRSLHFVFNSHKVTYLAWYETELWGDIFTAVAVVATIVSLGADGGLAMQLASATTAMAAAQVIAIGVFKFLIVQELFKIFVKIVGMDVAFVAAIIAAAYGLGDMIKEGTTALTTTAKEMLALANGLTKGIGNVLKDLMNDLSGMAKEFDLLKEEKTKLLEEAESLLDNNSILSPLVILGETPSQYYKRTVHSGNIGTLLIDDIHTYHSRNLMLPTFSQTIGGFNYG